MAIVLTKGHKNAISIQIFERQLKDREDYMHFASKLRKYIYKYNIFFKPAMIVPVHLINTKQNIGEFVKDNFGEGEFYVMARMSRTIRPGLKLRRPAKRVWGKIAFVKVMDVAGKETAWVKLLYPMTRYWFWRKT